ncbi:hypothetical protein PsYK624_074010 [Phanerochaete sordida]|uniref:Uncharacterized protein n=1 Tax=Phanerochaete sordida TaxID=48140 RepID=A0A9P3G8K1_9APHY|nr:hypothetical protein PsYK624_074010 [Phanerochaete sordida]
MTSIHDTPQRYEEYREFFAILRSGDASQYSRARTLAQSLVTPARRPSTAQLDTRPVQFKLKAIPIDESSEATSDTDSAPVDSEYQKLDIKDNIDTTEVSAMEPLSPITDDSSTDSGSSYGELLEYDDESDGAFPDIGQAPVDALDRLSITSVARTIDTDTEDVADAPNSEPGLTDIEDFLSKMPEADSNQESRRTFKQALRGLYSLESLRDVVRAFIRDSQETHVPLAEAEARRARAAAAGASISNENKAKTQELTVFRLLTEKPAPSPKKRCTTKSSAGARQSDGAKPKFHGAQLIKDLLSDGLSAGAAGKWAKPKPQSLGRAWLKSKKRTFTDVDE